MYILWLKAPWMIYAAQVGDPIIVIKGLIDDIGLAKLDMRSPRSPNVLFTSNIDLDDRVDLNCH